MPEPIVASAFAPTLARLRNRPSQAIILHGERGVGLATIANSLAGKNPILLRPMTKKGEYDPTNGSIIIEKIRELYADARTDSERYIIIDDADRMTVSAQNSLLKLLEEPTSKTHFILTTHHLGRLLPTIRSRATKYHVPVISENASRSIVQQSRLNETQIKQLLFLASGLPAELMRLSLDPDKLTAQATAMKLARTFLSDKSRYARLEVAMQKSSSRASAIELIDSALLIIKHTLYGDISKDSAETARRLLDMREAVSANANPRLQLVRFVLQ